MQREDRPAAASRRQVVTLVEHRAVVAPFTLASTRAPAQLRQAQSSKRPRTALRAAGACRSPPLKLTWQQLHQVQQGASPPACPWLGMTTAKLSTTRIAETTVEALGEVYRGPWAQRFWSSHGCSFHHAYPVGYRASKQVFNRPYRMQILACAATHTPVFQVRPPLLRA